MAPQKNHLLLQFPSFSDRALTPQFIDAAIGEDAVVLECTIDVHIKTLHRKLGKAGVARATRIQTVRGVGYRFRDTP